MRNPRRSLLGLAAVLLLCGAALTTGCSKDNPVAPARVEPKRVLVLEDGGTQDSVVRILDHAGFAVTRGGNYWQYTGTTLPQFDAVVLLCGKTYTAVMADSVQWKILDFVAKGGGLMSIEWMMYNTGKSRMDIVRSIMPATYGGSYANSTESYTVAMPSHPIAGGLPANFDVTGSWSWSKLVASTDPSRRATTVVTGSKSGAAVIAGVYGTGRTVHWSMAGQYNGADIWSNNVEGLLANIVSFISRRS